MSTKMFQNLSITGSIMEVPPPKESTIPRPIDKKRIVPLDIPKRNSANSIVANKALKSNRSFSQMSSQITSKKNSIVSLNGVEDQNKYEVKLK